MSLPFTFITLKRRTHEYANPAPTPPKNPARAGNMAVISNDGFITKAAPAIEIQIAASGTGMIFSPSMKKLKMTVKKGDILLRIDASAILILSSA